MVDALDMVQIIIQIYVNRDLQSIAVDLPTFGLFGRQNFLVLFCKLECVNWNVSVQVKRIHEYKRQLLNIFGIVYRYKKMKEMSASGRKAKFVPRVCMFGGKAFSTYVQAKRIVKFITDVAATINRDPGIGDLLKVS